MVLGLNYIDLEKDGWDPDPEYSIILTFSIAEMKLLLGSLIRSGVKIYDTNEMTI
jgi:hypothetical protein